MQISSRRAKEAEPRERVTLAGKITAIKVLEPLLIMMSLTYGRTGSSSETFETTLLNIE